MRLIDGDALFINLDGMMAVSPTGYIHGDTMADMINDAPTVDAEPIIRCKDCKFLRFTGTVWKCQNRLVMMLCEPNDYCSRAERKEE